MSKSGNDQTKEYTKIRRKLNRSRRRKIRQILNYTKDETMIPVLKNTSGWLTWWRTKPEQSSKVGVLGGTYDLGLVALFNKVDSEKAEKE